MIRHKTSVLLLSLFICSLASAVTTSSKIESSQPGELVIRQNRETGAKEFLASGRWKPMASNGDEAQLSEAAYWSDPYQGSNPPPRQPLPPPGPNGGPRYGQPPPGNYGGPLGPQGGGGYGYEQPQPCNCRQGGYNYGRGYYAPDPNRPPYSMNGYDYGQYDYAQPWSPQYWGPPPPTPSY